MNFQHGAIVKIHPCMSTVEQYGPEMSDTSSNASLSLFYPLVFNTCNILIM